MSIKRTFLRHIFAICPPGGHLKTRKKGIVNKFFCRIDAKHINDMHYLFLDNERIKL